jgi:hypothetical protein
VSFQELAERYPRSGGDIKNAVLKAAQLATFEPGPDPEKRIHQRHFVQGMEEVMAAQSVMSQSLYEARDAAALPTPRERQLLLIAGSALLVAIAALLTAILT